MPPSPIAAIFDMDGVIVHNIPFHKKAWKMFYAKRGKRLTTQIFQKDINGRLNSEILGHLFGRRIAANELRRYVKEKEELYQDAYRDHVALLPGLEQFLKQLKKANVPMAIATSAPPENVRFIFARTRVGRYITHVIDASRVKRGKPYPDIYLRAAKAIRRKPEACVVFEDSPLGIEAAKAAGAKVVAVMTTMKPEEARKADARIPDFTGISFKKLAMLFKKPAD